MFCRSVHDTLLLDTLIPMIDYEEFVEDIESLTVRDIQENLTSHVKSPKVSSILNPFGEPLTDADIQYAFEKVTKTRLSKF